VRRVGPTLHLSNYGLKVNIGHWGVNCSVSTPSLKADPASPGNNVTAFVLLAAIVAIPIVEIAILIEVGGVIGTWPTIGLVVLTALIGTALIRRQGVAVLAEVRAELSLGRPPVAAAIDGLFLVVAGALLLTPGFVTDAIGFAFLVPPLRHLVARALAGPLLRRDPVTPSPSAPSPRRPVRSDVIEADFIDVQDAPPPAGPGKHAAPDPSPWARDDGGPDRGPKDRDPKG
jgi:UPF0716 protein FxsA